MSAQKTEVVIDFLAQSSVHGLPRLANPGTVSRIAWTVFFLAALATYMFHSSFMIVQFFDEPSTMNYLPHGHKFSWPDLIICSEQQLSPTKFLSPDLNHPDSKDLVNRLNKLRNLRYNSDWKGNKYQRSHPLWSSISLPTLFQQFGNKDTVLANRRNNENQQSELIPHWSHFSCYRVVINATKYKDLYESQWVPIYMDLDNDLQNLSGTWEWNANPLHKNHFSEQDRFQLEPGIAIHFVHQGEFPTEQSTRITLKPSRNYRLTVTMKAMTTVNKKKSPCLEHPKTVQLINYLKGKHSKVSYTESEKTCTYRRVQHRLIKNCNCTSYRFPIEAIHSNVKYCFDYSDLLKTFDQTNEAPNIDLPAFNAEFKRLVSCISENNVVTTEDFESCLPKRNCRNHVYSVIPTSWSTHYSDVNLKSSKLIAKLHPPKKKNMTDVDYQKYARKYFNWIQVVRGETNSLLVEEQFTYYIKNLISDLGGMLGFYIGVSVLTVCELFEIIARVGNYVCCGFFGKKSNDPQNISLS